MIPNLRNYQERGINDLRREFLSHSAVLFVLPTGAGKTFCFTYMAGSAYQKGRRVLVLAHRRELIFQASETFSQFGIPHGLIMAGMDMDRRPVQIGMVQTVVKRLDKIEPPDFVIVDEAHHATASLYTKILESFPGAKILGVTATPQRTDGRGLGEIFTSIVIGPRSSGLMELGFLSKYRLFCPPQHFSLNGVKTVAGDYNKAQLARELDRSVVTGDAVDHYTKHGLGLSVAFCVSVEHAQNVAAQFNASGIPAASLDGSMSNDARSGILKRFEAGDIRVLSSCSLIEEGFDLPKVEGAILLRPTQSLIVFLQQVGRALRPAPGKSHAIILDHAGNSLRHGLPDDDRSWSLEGRKKGSKKRELDQISVRRCAECFNVYRSSEPKCPQCGSDSKNARHIETRNGELVEVTPEMERQGWLRTAFYDEALASCRTADDIKEMGKARGLKRGWMVHACKNRLGMTEFEALSALHGNKYAFSASMRGEVRDGSSPV